MTSYCSAENLQLNDINFITNIFLTEKWFLVTSHYYGVIMTILTASFLKDR